jgi:hypothetical protein
MYDWELLGIGYCDMFDSDIYWNFIGELEKECKEYTVVGD